MQQYSSHTSWLLSPDDLDFESHQVDVWRIKLDLLPATVKYLASTLSSDEALRAGQFHFPKDRERYIVAHRSLRNILAHYLQCNPDELSFNTNKYGKPTLKGNKLEFNLSHSGNYVLIAVARDHKVGIDVEQVRPNIEFESLARRFFSPTEVSELLALPLQQRKLAFFSCWTRKEAYIKAKGLGLSLPLDSFDVSLAPNQSTNLLATRPISQESGRWTLSSLDVGPGYAAAVAVEMRGPEFRLFDGNQLLGD